MYDLYVTALYYVGAIWKRRWPACLVAAVVSVIGWTAVILIPDSYQSSARIYVDTSNVLQPLLRGITVQTNMAAQVRLMQKTLLTRPKLEEVARATGYDLTASSPGEMDLLLEGLRKRTSVSATRPATRKSRARRPGMIPKTRINPGALEKPIVRSNSP